MSIKISSKAIKFIDGFLAQDIEKMYCDFALKWFKDKAMSFNASDEWKINFVLSPKEKGGMGAEPDIKKPKYKEIRNKINKLVALKNGLRKESLSPDLPFLLLNYLQTNSNLEQSYFARKELASKMMGENLLEKAEKSIAARDAYDKWLIKEAKIINKQAEKQHNAQLINREWQYYSKLPMKEKKNYQNKLGCTKINMPLEISFADFNAIPRKVPYFAPKEIYEKYSQCNRDIFHAAILAFAQKNGAEEAALYGMLNKGLKPYEIFAKDYNNFLKRAGIDHARQINFIFRQKLQDEWDKEYEKMIRNEVEKYINEVARSFAKAAKGMVEFFKQSREEIITKYIRRLVQTPLGSKKKSKNKFLKEKKLISGLKISPVQEKFLVGELPFLLKKQSLELLNILKSVSLLNHKETAVIQKIKENFKRGVF